MSNYLKKKSVLIFFILLLRYFASSHAQEYIYPIAVFPDNSIGFIYQSSCEKIELYKWDHLTKVVESGLYSRFSPAHIALLPYNVGFSFIDNGIIRIKFFHKRSPKSLEISEPLYNINAIFWKQELNSPTYGYFSAQYQDHYAMARIDLDAHITHIIFSKTADFLYPQKAGTNLFFIARSTQHSSMHYNLCKIKFDENCDNCEQKITDQEIENSEIQKTIHTEIAEQQLSEITFLDFGSQPICFLTMEDQVGSVISYVSHTDTHATFSYYQISQNQNSWCKKKLFDFVLPTSFLFTQGPNQLYEHIVPLLPKKIGGDIYFSHSTKYSEYSELEYLAENAESQAQDPGLMAPEINSNQSNINIFSYNLDTAGIQQITHACAPGEHYFCPLKQGEDLYYGGTVRAQ